jgi:hypothetical protein
MKLHKPSRPRTSAFWNRKIQLRRLVSAAVAQYRSPDFTDEFPLTPCSRLQAHLVPFDEQGKTGPSCQIEVKDFDERGITFHHPQPLHDRRALVVLEGLNLGRIAAEVDLSWCRFSSRGQYTSGGRFVQLVGKTA